VRVAPWGISITRSSAVADARAPRTMETSTIDGIDCGDMRWDDVTTAYPSAYLGAMTTTEALARFRQFYDTFSPAWIARLEELYAPTFVMADPFHTFTDIAAMRAYFTRILATLAETRFIVEDVATGADGSYVRWRWEWRRTRKDALRIVPGVTHLRFADDGRITSHRDLFDAAEGFYEALPVIGSALRAIKRRL
jgi:steroid Delta-isomerase